MVIYSSFSCNNSINIKRPSEHTIPSSWISKHLKWHILQNKITILNLCFSQNYPSITQNLPSKCFSSQFISVEVLFHSIYSQFRIILNIGKRKIFLKTSHWNLNKIDLNLSLSSFSFHTNAMKFRARRKKGREREEKINGGISI